MAGLGKKIHADGQGGDLEICWEDCAKAYWTYAGHRVREGVKPHASVAGILSMFRGLPWWRREQNSMLGVRHPRHFPQLMNEERCIAETVGTEEWRVVALNRAQWNSYLPQWLRTIAIPWASARQDSLPKL